MKFNSGNPYYSSYHKKKKASILKDLQRMRDMTHTALCQLTFNKFAPISDLCQIKKGKKGEVHTCTGTEALYRPYGP